MASQVASRKQLEQCGIAAIAAIAVGFLVSQDAAAISVLIAGALVIPVYWWLAERAGFALAALLLLLLPALLMPRNLALAVEVCLFLLAGWRTLRATIRGERVGYAGLAVLGLVVLWLGLAINPNVPSVQTGLLGVRKTAFFLVGLPIGMFWPRGNARTAELLLVRLLWVTGLAILAVHIFLPDVENSLSRGASRFTEEFAGEARVSGFFASPFDVSMLGSFLAIWGWHAFLSRAESRKWLPAAYALTGVSLLIAAGVRTGYLAVGIGVVATVLLRRPGRSRFLTAAATFIAVMLGSVLLVVLPVEDKAVESIPHVTTDSRVASRITTFEKAEEMVRDSPWVGWGAGSAGSTLQSAFFLRRHVTSHNMLVAFAVEGGLLALLAVAAALFFFASTTTDWRSISHPAAAATVALLGFGLSTDVSEALPISLLLMTLVGLRAHVTA